MVVCDLCNKVVTESDSYLLTTRQVVSNPTYWEFAFSHQWSYVEAMPDAGTIKGMLALQQANQSTPWLVCREHAEMLGANLSEAHEYAKRWWISDGRFAPSGSGPVQLSVVQMTRPTKAVSVSGLPRPSCVYVFGRGFLPSEDQMYQAMVGLLKRYEGILTTDHLSGIPTKLGVEPPSNREVFFSVVDRTKSQHPGAFVVDSLWLDQRTGQDTAIVVVWEGAVAEVAKRHLQKPLPSILPGLGQG